jgi:hypothetical protein
MLVRDYRLRLAKGEVNADFRLGQRGAVFAQHARSMGDGMFVEFDRHRYETAPWIPGSVRRKCARGHKPFGFEHDNAIGGRNLRSGRRAGSSVRGAGDPPKKLQNRRGQAVADWHVTHEIGRRSQENSEPLIEAWRLKDELCVSRQNQLTGSYRCACCADWSLILLARIMGIRSPKRLREPGTKRVETLHVVHCKGARAASTREANKRNCPVAIADHRVHKPAGTERCLYFPVIATLR